MTKRKVKSVTADGEPELESILSLTLSNCDLTVCLASVQDDAELPTFQSLQLSDNLTDEFRSLASHKVAALQAAQKKGDLRLISYDAGNKPDSHEVEILDLRANKPINQQISSLAKPVSLGTFEMDAEFLSGLRFYTIVVQPLKGDPSFFFRLYGPSKELSRSRLFGAIMAKGRFDRITKPTFLFDQGIDCVSNGDVMFILNTDGFQKIFRFFEMVKAAAREILGKIKDKIPIANFEEFEKACEGHLQMLAKLNNIANRPYLDRVTMADIKKVLTDFPDLRVKIVQENGKDMLLFDKSDKWELLRLLDDDYLLSIMTGEQYEVSAKRRVKRK
jgi:Kiwa protein KwaB-like